MNNKYRIVEEWSEQHSKKVFYPQLKGWFSWRTLKRHPEQTSETHFDTYEEAKAFLDDRMPKVHYPYASTDKEKIYFKKNEKQSF